MPGYRQAVLQNGTGTAETAGSRYAVLTVFETVLPGSFPVKNCQLIHAKAGLLSAEKSDSMLPVNNLKKE